MEQLRKKAEQELKQGGAPLATIQVHDDEIYIILCCQPIFIDCSGSILTLLLFVLLLLVFTLHLTPYIRLAGCSTGRAGANYA